MTASITTDNRDSFFSYGTQWLNDSANVTCFIAGVSGLPQSSRSEQQVPHSATCVCLRGSMCWDTICTVAKVWCCSEHYLWLFDGGFLLEAYDCNVSLSFSLFLRLLKRRKLAVCKLDLSRAGLTQCHSALDHGLNLHRNVPLSLKAMAESNVPSPNV